jgi:hypothetical protein
LAAFVFLVIAALQGVMASRRVQKPLQSEDPLPPKLPPLPNATELEKSRRELEALERRLDIPHTDQQGKER